MGSLRACSCRQAPFFLNCSFFHWIASNKSRTIRNFAGRVLPKLLCSAEAL